MLVRNLIDYLLDEVGSGRLTGSDEVPEALTDEILGGPVHLVPAQYLEGKLNTREGVDAGGQKNT